MNLTIQTSVVIDAEDTRPDEFDWAWASGEIESALQECEDRFTGDEMQPQIVELRIAVSEFIANLLAAVLPA